MHFSLFYSGALDKVPLYSINRRENFAREVSELHGMSRNTVQGGFARVILPVIESIVVFQPTSLAFMLSMMN